MTLLRAILPYLAAVVAVFALLFGAYEFGVHVEHQARVAEVADIKSQHATELAAAHKARADAEAEARATEAKRVADMAALDEHYQKELSDAKTAAERTIADVRNGALRLRERFTCPAATSTAGVMPQAGSSPSVGDAGQAGGLRTEDAEFLVRESERADEVARTLAACQAIVRKDRDGR